MKHYALAVAALLVACSHADDAIAPAAYAGPKRVVFVLVDTLRYDHVGRSGDPRGLTPRLDALAAEGVWFPHAMAASSWTRPSVASIMTGLHPGSHRVEGNDDALPPEIPTLAQLLAASGVTTLAVSANANGGRAFGLDRGFQQFRVPLERRGYEDDVTKIPGDVVVAKGLELLEGVGADEPCFLFLHMIDPHDPYLEHPGLLERPMPDGNFTGARRDLKLLDAAALEGEELAERDWLEDTLVVVTSDHGEELWSHGRRGHGYTLFQEMVHVPLILRFPPSLGIRDRECAAMVHHSDLMPTLLAWYGVPAPEGIAGADLWPAIMDRARHPGPASVISQLGARSGRWPTRARECATDFRQKLIVGHDGGKEWYDLDEDPRELRELSAAGAEPPAHLSQALSAALDAVARARAEGVRIPWEQLGDTVRSELEALGYAGD